MLCSANQTCTNSKVLIYKMDAISPNSTTQNGGFLFQCFQACGSLQPANANWKSFFLQYLDETYSHLGTASKTAQMYMQSEAEHSGGRVSIFHVTTLKGSAIEQPGLQVDCVTFTFPPVTHCCFFYYFCVSSVHHRTHLQGHNRSHIKVAVTPQKKKLYWWLSIHTTPIPYELQPREIHQG